MDDLPYFGDIVRFSRTTHYWHPSLCTSRKKRQILRPRLTGRGPLADHPDLWEAMDVCAVERRRGHILLTRAKGLPCRETTNLTEKILDLHLIGHQLDYPRTSAPTTEDLLRLQEEAKRWEEYNALQQKIARLQQECWVLQKELPVNQYQYSPPTPIDHNIEIKIKNIPIFTLAFTFQLRDEWLAELRSTFERAPWKYQSESQKILVAIAQMNNTCRQRWNRHVEEKLRNGQRKAIETWDYFKEWTLTLIRDTATLQLETMAQLTQAHQRPHQDPREFDVYLDALEQHFPRTTEENRALTFFVKLLPELRHYIHEHIIQIPKNRDEIVTIATHYWNLLGQTRKRKPNPYAMGPSKRSRRAKIESPILGHKDRPLKKYQNTMNKQKKPLRC
ncbi:hypothetical protein BDW67DRAFT_187321 [Aspergillus spinulosporus]